MSNRNRRYRRGFLESRSLLAIIVAITILPIVVSVFKITSEVHLDYDSVNDEISLLQLRKIMLISYDVENYGEELHFIYHNDDYKLSLVNERLILSPGYQVFLNNVDNAYFIEQDGTLSLVYERGDVVKEAYIYKEKGICISDFSDVDDQLSDDSFDDE